LTEVGRALIKQAANKFKVDAENAVATKKRKATNAIVDKLPAAKVPPKVKKEEGFNQLFFQPPRPVK
jgi:hypothetical protein